MLQDAVFELLKEKNVNEISVTELCAKANINRGSFYKYYTNIYDLLFQIKNKFLMSARETVDEIFAIEGKRKDRDLFREISFRSCGDGGELFGVGLSLLQIVIEDKIFKRKKISFRFYFSFFKDLRHDNSPDCKYFFAK